MLENESEKSEKTSLRFYSIRLTSKKYDSRTDSYKETADFKMSSETPLSPFLPILYRLSHKPDGHPEREKPLSKKKTAGLYRNGTGQQNNTNQSNHVSSGETAANDSRAERSYLKRRREKVLRYSLQLYHV